MSRFKQGRYIVRNPGKYLGDVSKVQYRSSWELRVNEFLDGNANILKWSSEEIPIKYLHPLDNKIHTYWPDYYVEYKKPDGTLCRDIIEVKPTKDGQRSKSRNPKTKMQGDITYVTNQAKWSHAKKFCEYHHINFRILTEKDLFR